MWDPELREASESFTELFFPSVQAQLVGEIGQSFSTICTIISKEASASERLFPQHNIRPLASPSSRRLVHIPAASIETCLRPGEGAKRLKGRAGDQQIMEKPHKASSKTPSGSSALISESSCL